MLPLSRPIFRTKTLPVSSILWAVTFAKIHYGAYLCSLDLFQVILRATTHLILIHAGVLKHAVDQEAFQYSSIHCRSIIISYLVNRNLHVLTPAWRKKYGSSPAKCDAETVLNQIQNPCFLSSNLFKSYSHSWNDSLSQHFLTRTVWSSGCWTLVYAWHESEPNQVASHERHSSFDKLRPADMVRYAGSVSKPYFYGPSWQRDATPCYFQNLWCQYGQNGSGVDSVSVPHVVYPTRPLDVAQCCQRNPGRRYLHRLSTAFLRW